VLGRVFLFDSSGYLWCRDSLRDSAQIGPFLPRALHAGMQIEDFSDEAQAMYVRDYGEYRSKNGTYRNCLLLTAEDTRGQFVLAPDVGLVALRIGTEGMLVLKDYHLGPPSATSPLRAEPGTAANERMKIVDGKILLQGLEGQRARILIFGPNGRLLASSEGVQDAEPDISKLHNSTGALLVRVFLGKTILNTRLTVVR
jgi:hypothetical protein